MHQIVSLRHVLGLTSQSLFPTALVKSMLVATGEFSVDVRYAKLKAFAVKHATFFLVSGGTSRALYSIHVIH
jgi:hypothetical protein